MKKLIIWLMTSSLFLASCESEKIDTPSASYDALRASTLLGQWKFKGYTDGKTPKYDVSLEFKNEEDKLTINGRSSVNFYFAETEIDESRKTIKIPVLGSTKIAGTPEANAFEMTYYESLRNVERYEFKDKNTLVIYLSKPANEALYFEKK
ncbi:META domain-containing protein [Emticicia sp. BO119]|uniref:META domain-containing protein n=1 Tax=Emticicia sp. BO119 TaxID=2757768 RepID=UPI0015F0B131|nr:META domain-containing protein [Emticicia sp. BO119]MBA4851579.1 META domain-containing protein [Emticicia sp. BO119]